MIIKPSIEELTKDGVNRYQLVIATAKCAHKVTEEYIRQREAADKKITNKETDKPLASMIDPALRDDKAVKSAIRLIHEGKYRIVSAPEQESEQNG